MRILVTGAGALLGQGIIRALKMSTLTNLQIIAADPNRLSAGLYWVEERYLLLNATDIHYFDSLCEVLNRAKPDILIPGTDVELQIISENKEYFEKTYGTKVLVSTPHVINISNDKFKTYEFFKSAGFTPPESCLPGAEECLIDKVGFPVIVKPRIGARSIGVFKANTMSELNSAISITVDPVIQEYVGDEKEEYTAGVLYFDNCCSASIIMKRDLRDGNTYKAYIEINEEFDRQVKAFAEALKPFGPANFQFRRDKDGRLRVFEINARFSGTTPLRALSGFNEVELSVRRLIMGEKIKQPDIKSIIILRHWEETIVYPEEIDNVKNIW